MAGIIRAIAAYVSITRPVNLILTVAIQYAMFFTFYRINAESSLYNAVINQNNIHFLTGLSITALAAGFIINDYFDRETDRINRPEKSRKLERFSDKFLLISYSLTILIGTILGFLFGLESSNYLLLILYWIATALLWWYSKSLISKPFWGNALVAGFCASVVFIFALLDYNFLIESNINGSNSLAILLGFAFFAFILTLIREIVKDVEDMKGDAIAGRKTLATTIPIQKVRTLLFIMFGILCTFGLIAIYWISVHLIESLIWVLICLVPTTLISGFYISRIPNENAAKFASLALKITMILSLIFILSLNYVGQ